MNTKVIEGKLMFTKKIDILLDLLNITKKIHDDNLDNLAKISISIFML